MSSIGMVGPIFANMYTRRDSFPQFNDRDQVDDSRRQGRLKCELLRCSIGDVIDLSASGMRVRAWGIRGLKANEHCDIRIRCIGRMAFVVRGEIVWVKRHGFMKYEAGVHFVDVTPEQQEKLTEAARISANARVMAADEI